MKKLILLLTLFIIGSCQNEEPQILSGTFIDNRDNQMYKTVQVGAQVWMAENLNFNVPNNSWYFLDDSTTYDESVGRLYNWESAKLAVPPG